MSDIPGPDDRGEVLNGRRPSGDCRLLHDLAKLVHEDSMKERERRSKRLEHGGAPVTGDGRSRGVVEVPARTTAGAVISSPGLTPSEERVTGI